jgi:hypothetical protein
MKRLTVSTPVLPHSSNHPQPPSSTISLLFLLGFVLVRRQFMLFSPLLPTALTICQAAPSFSHYSTNSLQVLQQLYLTQFLSVSLQSGVSFSGFYLYSSLCYWFEMQCGRSFAISIFSLM